MTPTDYGKETGYIKLASSSQVVKITFFSPGDTCGKRETIYLIIYLLFFFIQPKIQEADLSFDPKPNPALTAHGQKIGLYHSLRSKPN